jgi:hypothetical protein
LASNNGIFTGLKWLADEARHSAVSGIDREENMLAHIVSASILMSSKWPLSSFFIFATQRCTHYIPPPVCLLDLTALITDDNYVSRISSQRNCTQPLLSEPLTLKHLSTLHSKALVLHFLPLMLWITFYNLIM